MGDENDRNLKMSEEIAAEKAAAGGTEVVETAEKATTEMAEQAGEKPTKVNRKKREEVSKIEIKILKNNSFLYKYISHIKENSDDEAMELSVADKCCKCE